VFNKRVLPGHIKLLLFLFIIFLFPLQLLSQSNAGKEKMRINIINAETLEYSDQLGDNVQRLKGNVQFENKGTLLFCDSAYFYPNNYIEAFGNVHVNKGDSIHLYSDELRFYGDKQLTIASENVRLNDREMHLNTDELHFNLKNNISSYYTGAIIVNKNNTLTSKIGYYNSVNKIFSFKDSVELKNPEYRMVTDTLQFNTLSEIAYFYGPTFIYSEESTIYTEKGWYNTQTDKSELTLNNILYTEEQELKADSILYDRNTGIGEAFNNVAISDSTNKILITGEYTLYNQRSNRSFVTERATMIQAFKEDSLFLHADSLWVYRDTVENLNEIHAYYNARFFKPDIQGVCDSLVYVQKDSLIRMYTEPVLWSKDNQITGEYMEILLFDGEIKQLNIDTHAFIISEVDSIHFNQIKGRNMVAKFKNNEMDRIYVNGNGQTIYFAQDESTVPKKMIGVNKLDCANIIVHVKDSKIENMTFLTLPSGSLIPMEKADPSIMKLQEFKLKTDEKPLSKEDIYRRI
jgi:lipopolysaccharide assembly outer membrane protein LptD (OstA)